MRQMSARLIASDTARRNAVDRNQACLYAGRGEEGTWLNHIISDSSDAPASSTERGASRASSSNVSASTELIRSISPRRNLTSSMSRFC